MANQCYIVRDLMALVSIFVAWILDNWVRIGSKKFRGFEHYDAHKIKTYLRFVRYVFHIWDLNIFEENMYDHWVKDWVWSMQRLKSLLLFILNEPWSCVQEYNMLDVVEASNGTNIQVKKAAKFMLSSIINWRRAFWDSPQSCATNFSTSLMQVSFLQGTVLFRQHSKCNLGTRCLYVLGHELHEESKSCPKTWLRGQIAWLVNCI